ncbi:MAG: prolyl oligopeptidase family serine peptidase, partial [Myxococcota bacterium]
MIERPYGSWPSRIRAEPLAATQLRFSQPCLDRGAVYWLEGRAAQGGRQVVMALTDARRGGPPTECTPESVNVRTRVHEYGGGDYAVRDGRVFFVDFSDQRIHVGGPDGTVPLSAEGARYADFEITPDGRWLFAVEERPREAGEPENRLVVFELPPQGQPVRPRAPGVVASGHDFYSFPAISPGGDRLTFTAWSHPDMPWDATTLFVMNWSAEGSGGEPRIVAGGQGESIFQPRFSPSGDLTFISDRSGWWNLYQLRGDSVRALCVLEEEFGVAQWVFGLSRYGFVSDKEILCAHGRPGGVRLGRLDLESGALTDLDLPYRDFSGVCVEGGLAAFIGQCFDRAPAIVVLDLVSGDFQEVPRTSTLPLDSDSLVVPEEIEFESVEGRRAHGWFYPPGRADVAASRSERPPLLVKSHGGPTSSAFPTLDLRIQYWVDRGIGVVDVDYGGSTGYGRAYRELLRGQWGVVDVEDCVEAARFLAGQGHVDPDRLVISGGSAGGFTTLCALTFHDTFRAGASHYGIGDLEALARDTHKFESRYLDGLVGPYPEARELYRARSPIH